MNDKEPISFGRSFTAIAWLLALVLLGFVFQDLLDDQYNPNQEPTLQTDNSGNSKVILQKNRYGHYVSSGQINGKEVTFLLDTGATNVSIPAPVAASLNLKKGLKYQVQTANGVIDVYQTQLNDLRIGDITLYNVRANINPHMDDDEVLLGMSVLGQLEFRQRGDQLILQEQF